ncbi:MFS transporter [Polymorphobacter glacialis]|uniref:MFS transporter n=1 Tax=Sandarakinorhabdus glacialis TaxID=1614636 RepID=A0A917A055_9SPHN|nr:MFS transporter [Polymorphobacter glacialis]GGE18851.1 MFS transporter [Polymorphobacter glacialis]
MLFASPAINAIEPKATRIDLFSFSTPQMRAFHITWMAFFVCFFAWFAAAPLMPLIKAEFGLSKDQIANINIAAVAVTILVRLVIGPLCDRFGPRRAYTWLLLLGALPVFGLAFAQTYEAFLFFRLAIGAIGASFVITQYHTSVMFAPNVVGTANATVGGWGNAGGGAAQSLMPLVVAAMIGLGVEQAFGWRAAMFVPGVAMLAMAFVYARYTQDTPQGDIVDMRAAGMDIHGGKKGGWGIFKQAAANYRTWLLAIAYGASFGVEIFIQNIVASYYVDTFELSLANAGFAAGIFGGLALFARALGGIASDRIALLKGLDGRTLLLFTLMLGEGIGLLFFGHAATVTTAIIAMTVFGLFTHMACGATYALVPFVDRKALGGVAGLIGAGGNIGAVAAGFLNKASATPQDCLIVLGYVVAGCSLCALAVRFSPAHKSAERALLDEALELRRTGAAVGTGLPA